MSRLSPPVAAVRPGAHEASDAIAVRRARGPHVVFVNRYFFPDHAATSQLLGDLAFALADRGVRITVVTSRQRYDDADADLPAIEIVRGVAIRRVRTSRFGRARLAGRLLDYLTFYPAAAWHVWRHARRGDVVVTKTDPPMLSVATAPAAWARGALRINWLQDLFPEVASALGLATTPVRQWTFAALARLRDASLSGARANVVLGSRMAERLHGRGIAGERVHVIPNWSDGALIYSVPRHDNALRRAWDLDDAFVVGYSGNLGRAHDIETIVQAAEQIERGAAAIGRRVVWLFIGAGAQLAPLQDAITRRGLKSFQFRPYQPRERLAESLSVADVHLVSLKPDLEGLIVPSKYYGIAAAGRAAVFIGDADGEIARIIGAANAGVTVAPGDGVALARAIAHLASDRAACDAMGAAARRQFERDNDFPVALNAWCDLLDIAAEPSAMGSPGAPRPLTDMQ